MKKNILLVYPKIPENTYWSFHNSLQFIGKKAAMPPLGLITIAGMIDEEKYNLKLIDENVSNLGDRHLTWADMVFTSSMVIQSDSLETIISRSKAMDKTIVVGGPHPTQFFDRIQGDVDHFVLGEAESGVFQQFMGDLEHNDAKKAYAKIAMRRTKTGNMIDTAEYQRMKSFFGETGVFEILSQRPDINLAPDPRYDLLKLNKYGSMAIQLSRGCPYNCEFCNEPSLFGQVPRLKSKDKFVNELKILYDLGYDGAVFVVDDNFIGSVKEVKEVLPAIQQFQQDHNYPFSLFTEASINLSNDKELMTSMRDAGFNMVFVGIESPDNDALKTAGKHINVNIDILDAIRKIHSYGIEVTAGLIVGMDNEPSDICDKIFELCQEAGIPTAMAGLLIAAPGSELFYRYQREGRLLDYYMDGNNTHSFQLGYVPDKDRDPNQIVSSYKQLLSKLYHDDGVNYFARCRKLLEDIKPGQNFTRSVGYTEIRALFMSLWKQTFSSYGKAYRQFLMYAVKEKFSLLPEAVTLAIKGHHLMEITKYALNN